MLFLFYGLKVKNGSISIYIHEQSMTPPSIDFCWHNFDIIQCWPSCCCCCCWLWRIVSLICCFSIRPSPQSILLYHHIANPINHNNGDTYCNAALARETFARTMSVDSQQSQEAESQQLRAADNVCCCATASSNHCSQLFSIWAQGAHRHNSIC